MKVLICVNDLLFDEPGLLFGGMIAHDLQAEITLFHVIPQERELGNQDEGEHLLKRASSILGDYPVAIKVGRGQVVNQIVAESERGGYDMVIVSVSQIGEGRQPVLPVHKSLLRNLPCCLLAVKNPRAELKRMLICTGGLQMTEALVQVGAKIANATGADTTLFHVAANVPTMYTGLKTIEETLVELLQTDTPVSRHLRRGAEILSEHNIQAELKLRHGSAVYEIVREIDRQNYDMVVIGASGADTMIKEWFYGNITQNIVDAVGIPVLVVNQERAAKSSKFNS